MHGDAHEYARGHVNVGASARGSDNRRGVSVRAPPLFYLRYPFTNAIYKVSRV